MSNEPQSSLLLPADRNGWLDWRRIEMMNDWGIREKSDAMADKWDESAAMWDARWKSEEDFTKEQADALGLLLDDTVLDIGCGTGPLALNIAERVAHVTAMDSGRAMLDLLEKNAQERGVHNITTLRGNFATLEPGIDLPICDVAITRWSPAQGNILKMSRCATRRCYSVSTCAPRFAANGATTGAYWCRSTEDEELNTTPRPCPRKYGFNVHFNLLYDHGANPTLSYVRKRTRIDAGTHDELQRKMHGRFASPPRHFAPNGEDRFPADFMGGTIEHLDCDMWRFELDTDVAILGWDPSDIVY